MYIERRDERVGEVEQAAHTNPARSSEMNYRYDCTVSTKEKKERPPAAALALAVGLALACLGSAALAINDPIPGIDIVVKPGGGITAPRPAGSDLPTSNKPIPGIDIVVKKNPSGIPVVVPIDDSGKFSLRLKEPGNHTISTACRQPSGCLPHKLSGALKPGVDGEPSIIAILIGLLLPAQKASADGTSYTFTVGDRGVVLSGQIPGAAGVRVAAGDVNGDGVETRKAAPKKAAGKSAAAEPRDIYLKPPVTPRNNGDAELPGTHRDRLINNSETAIYSAAPPPKGGDDKLPGLAGDPIPGVDVKLGKNPGGSIVASSKTDNQGNFHFDKLPAGNYELTLPGLPAQSLTVGADGIAGGKVMRGPDGSMSIFDRWGNRTASSAKGGGSKTAEKPVGFGSGNTLGAGPGMGGPMLPGALPGLGPMGPGAGPGMGGPMGAGGAMGRRP